MFEAEVGASLQRTLLLCLASMFVCCLFPLFSTRVSCPCFHVLTTVAFLCLRLCLSCSLACFLIASYLSIPFPCCVYFFDFLDLLVSACVHEACCLLLLFLSALYIFIRSSFRKIIHTGHLPSPLASFAYIGLPQASVSFGAEQTARTSCWSLVRWSAAHSFAPFVSTLGIRTVLWLPYPIQSPAK